MLGALRNKTKWDWAAFGKHPVAKDFFRLGPGLPILDAFSGWLEAGYTSLVKKGESPGFYSWRFWARGVRAGHILCGLLRGSSDSIGRLFPLMIIGAGTMKGWEKSWDLLPFAFDNVWNRMEYIASRPYRDINDLKDDLASLSVAPLKWKELSKEREKLKKGSDWNKALGFGLSHGKSMADKVRAVSATDNAMFSLDHGYFNDHFAKVGFWHFAIKSAGSGIPNAVFVGGLENRAYMAIYKRPLANDDFAGLCKPSSKAGI